MSMKDCHPGWYVERNLTSWWIHLGLYVLRIGKPWGHDYKYAWRPLFQLFKCFKHY